MIVSIPAHISGFWYVVKSDNLLAMGTLGAGITLKPHVIITNSRYNLKESFIEYSDRIIEFKPYNLAVKLANLPYKSIKVVFKGSLGAGYGLSAAITLGGLIISYYSMYRDIDLNFIGRYAHLSEVYNLTGYGDVIAELYGCMIVMRIKPGAPGYGAIDIIPVKDKVNVITIELSRYTTSEMFRLFGNKIARYGYEAYDKFSRNPSLESFLENAYIFSYRTGMLNRNLDTAVKDKLKTYIKRGGVLGYFVKKGLLVLCVDYNIANEVFNEIRIFGRPEIFNLCDKSLNIEY